MDYEKRYETGLKLRDGITLYYRVSAPADRKAIVIFIHGIGEHCGRYDFLTQKMNDAGYGVVRFDLRGHGKSGGERGYAKDFHEFPDDVNEVVSKVKE
ncbi:MAG: alpha/beta hydrolase, partial [Saccharofermentanales bacterium]